MADLDPRPRHRPRRTKPARPSSVARQHPPSAGVLEPPDLDPLIHERLRLGILSALAVNATLTFNELKAILKATDGNLSVHARKLEEARYITCTKSFEGRLPRTEFRITEGGRRALLRYLDHMEALILAMRGRR